MPIQDPDRLTFGKLDTGETLEVQYNPEELAEQIEAVYARLVIGGMSHELLQYDHTKSLSLSCTVKFDAVTSYRGGTYDVNGARRFLMGAMYSRQATAQIAGAGAPSSVMVMWPNLYTLTCKLTAYDGRLYWFGQSGKLLRWDAKLKFEECRDFRLWAEDVEAQGTLRPASGPVDPTSTSANGG